MKREVLNLTKIRVLVAVGLIIACISTLAVAETPSPVVDPDRELIVMFKPGAITPPEGKTKGRLDEFQITSDTLRQILENANVEAISRLIPDFQSEDRFTISRTGESVVLRDWTNVYLLRVPVAQAREALTTALSNQSDVVYAEPNGRGEPDLLPNDQFFNRQWAVKNDGTAIQGNGTPGADIKATQAWDITTGSSSIKIAIVDAGMQTSHPDFAGRVSGDAGDNDAHGTAVAGVAAAQGNNDIGIAGVAWNVGIINEDYGNASDANFANAVISAANRGADVINNSWKLTPVGRYSITVRSAFADVYKLNRTAVASMGNQYGEVVQYPAAFGQGIITVGATTNTDVKADYSSTGNWIDVTAPGGGGFGDQNEPEDDIYSTAPGSGYGWVHGTSFSTPHVSGLAALLLSHNPNLYNDDIEQIIRLGVEDVNQDQYPGFDPYLGTGRVDAQKAFEFFKAPYYFAHWEASGSYVASQTDPFSMCFFDTPGLPYDGCYYLAKRYDVRHDVTFPYSYYSLPHVWGRGVATISYSGANPNYAMGYSSPVEGSITSTGCVMRSFVYEVWDAWEPTYYGWFPCTPAEVHFAYSVLGDLVLQVPTNFMAVAKFLEGKIKILWDDNNLNELGYEIERKDATNDEWIQIATTDSNVTVYWDANIMGSETYWYRIRAYNQNQTSAWTAEDQEKNYPNPPRNLMASVTWTPCDFGGFGGVGTMGIQPSCPTNEVTLSWDEPANQKPNTVAYYTIYAEDDDSWWRIWSPVYGTERVVCMPKLNHTYHFEVNTVDYADEPSRASNQANATTGWEWLCEPEWDTPAKMVSDEEISCKSFSLHQNYPNPFNLETQISFDLPIDCKVSVKIYNVTGQLVRTLVNGYMSAGLRNIEWDGTDNRGNTVASGIYFYRLEAENFVSIKKMLLTK